MSSQTKNLSYTLVTGGSGGIGLALAEEFAAHGHSLILVARSESKLQKAARDIHKAHGVDIRTLVADLSDPAAPSDIVRWLERHHLAVDILVNNAGFATYGPFAEADPGAEADLIQVNVTALTILTRLLLPEMLRAKSGRVLNVASTAAFLPGPFMAVYYASKAYVLSFSEALYSELSGTGVSVTALCPGPTKTGFEARSGVTKTRLFRGRLRTAESVAQAGYRGVMKRTVLVFPSFGNRLVPWLVRIVPRRLAFTVIRRLHSRAS